MPTDPNPVDVDLGLVGQVVRSDILVPINIFARKHPRRMETDKIDN